VKNYGMYYSGLRINVTIQIRWTLSISRHCRFTL